MKTLDVTTNVGKITLNIPTKFNEITKEWLSNVTKEIHLAPYHSLIAVIFRDNLATLLNTKRKDGKSVAGVSVFVKTYDENDEYIGLIECGTPIIVAPSDIAMGHHVIAPNNSISPNKIAGLINSDSVLRSKVFIDNETIYPVEFKIIPNSAIHGDIVESSSTFEDPFINKVTSENIILS